MIYALTSKNGKKWGDLIILIIDANEDITNRDLSRALSQLNIIEVITNKYSSSQGVKPTFNRG